MGAITSKPPLNHCWLQVATGVFPIEPLQRFRGRLEQLLPLRARGGQGQGVATGVLGPEVNVENHGEKTQAPRNGEI